MSGSLSLNAESLYGDLLRALQPQWGANDRLVGITSGGAWLAERLQADLGLSEPAGVISSAMHRDDFARRGLADGGVTRLPFEIEGAHLWIIDDVLYTGRTVRAVINELYDYGRPASVRLAVMVSTFRSPWSALAVATARSACSIAATGLPIERYVLLSVL